MLLFIASIYKAIKHSPSPILQDIDTFHVAKICQALPSTEQPDILYHFDQVFVACDL